MLKFFTKYILPCIFLGVTGGCTNELPWPETPSTDSISLVKDPEVYAWSGNQVWRDEVGVKSLPAMYSSRPESNQWGEDIYKDFPRPEDITEEELQKVLEVFNQPGKESYEPLIDWENFFVQQVWKGTASYTAGNGETVIGGDKMNWLCCGSEEMGNDHVNNFNNSNGSVMLMFNSSTKRWGYSSSSDSGHIFYYFRMECIEYEPGKWAYYVGLDFSAEGQNPNEQVKRDFIYNDWIIKIVPGLGVDVIPPTNGDNPSLNPEPGVENKEVIDHVEVNLSIEERKDIEWLASHLSIHVRAITDVEVFIKIPSKYYCDVDDMAIVQKHEGNFMIHGGPREIIYNINGNPIKLTVSFEYEGVRVTTDGINEDVINYCQENYGDGITFEVWNYFNITKEQWNHGLNGEDGVNPGANESITVEELKWNLNQSTVEFLDREPSLYVNAFNDTESGAIFSDDCTVSIINRQGGDFHTGELGVWYNGSSYNQLYYKK